MEILAPCGSPEHLKAAVYAGADAVYIGGRGFSARRNAVNFDSDEMRRAAVFCRGFGVKMYVAVNILTRDGEWAALRSYLTELSELAPDALIIQDMGVARYCREIMPDMPLHASTQMSVHSAEGAAFCESAGFSRVVIARECDRDTLAAITGRNTIGIEVFVHGALCVSVSGQCRLSALIGGRSGNRGLCAQPCRLDFCSDKRHYALSLKDLSLVRQIRELEALGVCSLKIEGRMKRPEYVAAAVSACRTALDGGEPDMERLRAVFSRDGFTAGYYRGYHADMGGVRTVEDVRAGVAVLPELSGLMRAASGRVRVTLEFSAGHGRACELSMSDGESRACVLGAPPESAERRETCEHDLRRFLSRLGGTPYKAEDIKIDIEPGIALPASRINAMRREVCEKLTAMRAERPRYTIHEESPVPHVEAYRGKPALYLHCRTAEQALAASGADMVILPHEVAERVLGKPGLPAVAIDAGAFITDEEALIKRLEALREAGIRRLVCQNPAQARIGQRLGYMLYGGLGLNVFNSRSAAFWAGEGFAGLCASAELKLVQALGLGGAIDIGLAAYGRLPLMVLRRCPHGRVCESGTACPGVLTDRTGRRFPTNCFGSYQELLNADVLWMADKLPELRGAAFLSLLLYDETPGRVAEILRAYREGAPPPKGYTRGLFYRGIE